MMFSKEDYESYINQILEIENAMETNIRQLMAEISDSEINALLNIILKDEQHHLELLGEIKNIINNQ